MGAAVVALWLLTRVRTAVLVVLAAVTQTTLLDQVGVGRAHPDLLLLLPIAAGLVGGSEAGAVVGFGAGLLADVGIMTNPFGLSALAFALVGFGVGTFYDNWRRGPWWTPVAVALVGSAAGTVLLVAIGGVLGLTDVVADVRHLGVVLAVVTVANGLMGWPVARILAWALAAPWGDDARPPGDRLRKLRLG